VEYYSAIKKNEIMSFSEKSDKEREVSHVLSHMWKLKKKKKKKKRQPGSKRDTIREW
jgi:hypothetical protein